MRDQLRLTSAVFGVVTGVVALFGTATFSGAQTAAPRAPQPTGSLAAFASGSLHGRVRDERGAAVAGATVSALGGTTAVAVTDANGRYEIRTLAPGNYVVRAHLSGYTAARSQTVQVRSSVRTPLYISLRRATPVVAAGIAALDAGPEPPVAAGAATREPADDRSTVDEGELAWRLRHQRRGVLRETTLAGIEPQVDGRAFVAREFVAAAQFAADFITGTPWSGEVNLLTSGSFNSPEELFSLDTMARNTAYVSLTAPRGAADWTIRGALTQADISSWILSGSYRQRDVDGHRYEMGLSYSTQRYDGGNPLALRDITNGSRNVGEVYGFDTMSVAPGILVNYGARYGRYDYLQTRNLVSPRLEVTVMPASNFRLKGLVSRHAVAPGAEEFLPPGESGLWLPPQRTFSAIEPGGPLTAEEIDHAAFAIEREVGRSIIGLRAFHQQVSNQMVTVFGAELPQQPVAKLGHYLVGNSGNSRVTGAAASVEMTLPRGFRGSVEYSLADARFRPNDNAVQYVALMLTPEAPRMAERIHNVAAALEADVPETATRVLMLYRISNGFTDAVDAGAGGVISTRPMVDSRFDVQLRQSLAFMSSSAAKWEMLLAIGNFFREPTAEQSVYDELLVIRPPKRVVGGLSLSF